MLGTDGETVWASDGLNRLQSSLATTFGKHAESIAG